ncbi:wings apart-like protein homolog isoform X2 [Macrobrachium nipponense]|uniref:wings apart-like protein homolog isoform X2 n=1 Tax=Macrobrachium nipponense TaxID=159736 RepID=UPI0030C86C49
MLRASSKMSGRYSRTYSRKKAAPPPISQFDKLVTTDSGSSTRPSVKKTAGHVGKWGITSFTSLRNINGGLGKEESNKRPYPDDSPPSGIGDDAFRYDGGAANGASLQVKPPISTFSKPRKFFKSRTSDCVSEPVRPSVPDKSRGKVSDGLSNIKLPPLPSLDTPDSSQSSLKDMRESSPVTVPKVSVPKPNNSETVVTSSRSGSGIKLKIFKSRDDASCSQETYSSTVELPSDDSRANSASTSNASSPSTKDYSEGNPDSSEEYGAGASPQPEYKAPEINIAAASARATMLCSPDRLESPNRTLNSSYDSSFEFPGLVDQRTGLPIDVCQDDSDYSFSGTQTKCQTPQSVNNDNSVSNAKKTYGSKVTKSCELNKYLTKNMVSSVSEIDTQQNPINESVCDGSLNDDFDLPEFGVGSSDFGVPEKLPPLERGISPGVSSVGGGESGDNIDLFSTDFDENEIEDRTNIDPANLDNIEPKDTNTMADTAEEEDMFSSQGSFESFRRTHSTKSESEVSKTDQPAPSIKKRSIFKSRNADSDAKKRATYKHKWHDQEDKEETTKEVPATLPSSQSMVSSTSPFEDFDFDPPSALKRVHTWPATSSGSLDDSTDKQSVTSVKCPKVAKQFYTVVKNVKKTHQLQESGEFQEFNDDVEYFLDALRAAMPVSTRCLAALNLAQKCMVPAFRMHLRAHGTVIKFFNSLSDAHTDHKLAICAATVMFTLSQDRLNMDLDRDSLELMLNLLESDAESSSTLSPADKTMVEQNKKKIRELCRDMQKKGHAKHLNLDNINAGHLAMETLLSLTSKRAGEWFKEELRELGGIEHLIRTITQCTQVFSPELETWTHPLLEKLTKVDRCLKVLENVTHQNVANQEYLLKFQNGIFPEKLMSLYRLCHVEVPLYPMSEAHQHNTTIGGVSTGQLLVQALLTTVKVLINLTHNPGKEALGSQLLGHEKEIYDITLYCLLIMPRYLSHDIRFELIILACSLLLNLVEHSKNNRVILMKTKAPDFLDTDTNDIFKSVGERKGAMQALVELFYRSEASARQQEAHTDEIIDHDLAKKQQEDEKKDDEIEETVARLLQKAGHHMEDTLIAAYTALLTGYCIMDDEDREAEIRAMLPDSKFTLMVTVLRKFLRFMDLTATTSLLRSLKPTEKVVKYMEKLDVTPEEEAEVEKKKQQQQQEEEESEGYAFGF